MIKCLNGKTLSIYQEVHGAQLFATILSLLLVEKVSKRITLLMKVFKRKLFLTGETENLRKLCNLMRKSCSSSSLQYPLNIYSDSTKMESELFLRESFLKCCCRINFLRLSNGTFSEGKERSIMETLS